MSKPPPKNHDSVQAQVEQLTAEAKRLNGAGKEAQALEVYRKAADLMLGAPWLQHRTAELARKLKQPEIAALHYRRAAAAFIIAGFPKRGLAPLRTAWTLCIAALPANAASFVSLTLDLAELQRELGFTADGSLSIANANEALLAKNCSEVVPELGELAARPDTTRPLRASEPVLPPESGIKTTAQAVSPGFFARVRSAMKP